MAALHDVEHLLLVLAEDVPAAAVTGRPERVTTCRNYHLTPADEDRAERIWPGFAVALREADVTVHLRASLPDTLGDITVLEADLDTVETVLTRLAAGELPDGTLVAIALAGGDADAVEESWGAALGAPGTLLLHTPWTERAWVSDEVCDHTSLIQLCERWTASRGHEARAWLSEWRRRVCGDLVGALDLGDAAADADADADAETRADVASRPLPYAPAAELGLEPGPEGDTVVLHLTNAGGTRGVHLRIDDRARQSGATVPASPLARPRVVTVPVAVREGRYDVTVTGPGGFARHFDGELTDAHALPGRFG